MSELILKVKALVESLGSVEELIKARDELRAPFNEKIRVLEKAEREAKRAVQEGEAQRLCAALRPGEKVKMVEHGFLDLFNDVSESVFYDADATVYQYQPRKRILWLNVTGTRGKRKIKIVRPFTLRDVSQYHVRRAAE